jgi:hypothetical protein
VSVHARCRLPALAVVLALGAAGALTACDLEPIGIACTEIGCSDGLSVSLDGTAPTGTIIEVEDEDGSTMSIECGVDWPCQNSVFFAGFTPDRVTVTVTNAAGVRTAVFDPDYEAFRPNGPGCEPECVQAVVDMELPATVSPTVSV